MRKATGSHLAIVDGDVATSAKGTSADASTNSPAECFHGSTVDGHLTPIATIATTDASTSVTASVTRAPMGIDITTVNGDGIALIAVFPTANASSFFATVCLHFAVPNFDVAIGAVFATANAGSIFTSPGCNNTSIDGDRFTFTVGTPLADTSATFPALCGDRTTIDGNGSNAAASTVAATNAGIVLRACLGIDGAAFHHKVSGRRVIPSSDARTAVGMGLNLA